MQPNFLPEIQNGNIKSLARSISLIENQEPGSDELLKKLPFSDTPVIGITGPPGVGKSTLVNELIRGIVKQGKKTSVLCIDPSSPFHHGAFLGDRVRMNQWSGDSSVYIRSLSSRGSLGGLHPRIFEITDLLKAAPYDYILIETVGVGQSDLEIAGIADFTIMILMAGFGDEIQTLKSGILEIADLFVVNKADNPQTKQFINNLQSALKLGSKHVDILETIATEGIGVDRVLQAIDNREIYTEKKRNLILAEKAYRLILAGQMKGINKSELMDKIKTQLQSESFNIYNFVCKYLSGLK